MKIRRSRSCRCHSLSVAEKFNHNSFFFAVNFAALTAVRLPCPIAYIKYIYVRGHQLVPGSDVRNTLRRRLHLEWNVVREGVWIYKIYQYAFTSAHAFHPELTHRTAASRES